MTDDELRSLVREAIARHLGQDVSAPAAAVHPTPRDPAWRAHPSFGKFLTLHNDPRGACLIEPAVQCTHCGFCLSYGH
jgi:hypothetical protein